jgi:hypothetical protein
MIVILDFLSGLLLFYIKNYGYNCDNSKMFHHFGPGGIREMAPISLKTSFTPSLNAFEKSEAYVSVFVKRFAMNKTIFITIRFS